ncbi:MAG: hypothetical protein AVDCRST_MAG93-7415 [uncultured Chloroflexia bacterium]|uniref:Uncharacterized protein n=1 Tax=uncultured Chloroflexia bacterium TaxID=1672391 RepID=A0A6J4MEF6_9CHLR|nr:MAG: hypothetical protein AVDCRST_MAG93-7415 [uncultured Chloroflexia bacterium]
MTRGRVLTLIWRQSTHLITSDCLSVLPEKERHPITLWHQK